MHIVHIASELAPIAKVGGLGDVLYGLCKELVKRHHKIHILLPKYDTINENLLENLQPVYENLWVYEDGQNHNNTIWSATLEGLPLLLIDSHHSKNFFRRGAIYGFPDDIDRFCYFSKVCMEFLYKTEMRPDIIHVHDWQTALIPVLQEDFYKPLNWKPAPTVLTVHNLEYQGKCSPHNLSRIGLKGEDYLSSDKLQDTSRPDLVNMLKGGILYANTITTVSPSYKKEIMHADQGFGLETVLSSHQNKIHGILNGIDDYFWNPEIDPALPYHFPAHPPFSKERWELFKHNKKLNQLTLRSQLGLADSQTPLIACISRLVEQKGVFLIAQSFEHLLSIGAQCVILGSVFSQEILDLFLHLQSSYASNTEGRIILTYNENLAHQLYASSDMLIIPSLFEPCGLAQMIGLRYGSIPIVRKTGGLADTVFDIDTPYCNGRLKNGFTFDLPNKEELCSTIDRAVNLWKTSPETWDNLMQQGLSQDFSWKSSAQQYETLYKTL